jgi:hypothetical protein
MAFAEFQLFTMKRGKHQHPNQQGQRECDQCEEELGHCWKAYIRFFVSCKK